MKKQVSTLFLRGVIIIIGLIVLVLCAVVLPVGIRAEDTDGYRPILLGLYLPAIPFFIALHQAFRLLNYIDKHMAFSVFSVQALRNIKYSGAAIAGLFTAGMPYIFYAADKDDAPGVVAIGLVIIGVSIVVSAFAALMQKLFQNAVAIKTENDLTV